MSIWSSISKGLSNLFRGGSAAGSAAGAASAATAATTMSASVISWASAAKLAVAGGFTYLFLSGGASNVVAKTLGISEPVAQVLIIFLFLVMLLLILRYLINYARDRFGLETEYLSRPIVRKDDIDRSHGGDRGSYSGSYRDGYDRRYYDGSSYRGPGNGQSYRYGTGDQRSRGRYRCSGFR